MELVIVSGGSLATPKMVEVWKNESYPIFSNPPWQVGPWYLAQWLRCIR